MANAWLRGLGKPLTVAYPDSRAGLPEGQAVNIQLNRGACTNCGDCVGVCPTAALRVDAAGLVVDHGACIACNRCVPACPQGALAPGQEFELAVRGRADLMERPPGHSNGSRGPAGPAARLGDEARRVFGRSLHVRAVDAGSCNGCEVEVSQLLNPYYDLERLGIQFVASPRHADLALVTGPPTTHMAPALRSAYEAMPPPRLVVAVGACGIMGGPFAGSYAVHPGVASIVPVDVFIPGCPPRPEALLHGLLLAVGRAEQRMRDGRTDTHGGT